MKEEKIYLTFPTDRETADTLKAMAQLLEKTQPELINEIIKDFIKVIRSLPKEDN